MSRSQRERTSLGEMARTTVTRRFFLTMLLALKYNLFPQDDRKFKKKGRRANARDFIIDEAEVGQVQVSEYFKSHIFRLTLTMRRTKTPGGTMATGTLSTPTRRTKLARLLPTWRLTCVSEIARLARVVSKWTRWTSRRLKSIIGTGSQVKSLIVKCVLKTCFSISIATSMV